MLVLRKTVRLNNPTRSPHFWAALAFCLRISALVSLSLTGSALERAAHMRPGHGANLSATAFLRNRTSYIQLTEDEQAYQEIAQNIIAGHGFATDNGWLIAKKGEPTAYSGCGYPIFIASSYFLFGKGNQLVFFVVQILLQSMVIYLIFQLAGEIAGTVAAQLAAANYALNPLLIWLSIAMMSEALVGPLLVLYVWLLHRILRSPRDLPLVLLASLGACSAALAETRSITVLLTVAALALVALKIGGTVSTGFRLLRCLVMIVAFTVVCAPWTIRNYRLWHKWIPFSTKAGTNAYMHNHSGLRVGLSERVVSGESPWTSFLPIFRVFRTSRRAIGG